MSFRVRQPLTILLLGLFSAGSSLHTNYPILYTAAYATAQELHRLLGDIASKRPLKLHQAPNEEQLHVLKSNQERRDLDALACDEYAQLVKDAKLQSGKWDEILQARQEKEQREKTTVHVREESVLNMYGNVADELKDTGARNSANAHLKEQREEVSVSADTAYRRTFANEC